MSSWFYYQITCLPVLLVLFGGIFGCKINEHEHHFNWTDARRVGRCFVLALLFSTCVSNHLVLPLNGALKYVSENS